MKTRVIVVVVSVVLGLVATLGLAAYINGIRAQVAEGDDLVSVVVAQSDVPVGASAEELINSDTFVEKKVPRKYAVANAVSSLKPIAKQVVAQPISKGEQVTTAKFREPTQIGFSYRVPDGKRAVSVGIDEITGVSKMLMPHDHVDVIVTLKDGTDGKPTTKIFLQDLEVLAIDRTTDRPGEEGTKQEQSGSGTNAVGLKLTQSEQKASQSKATATLAVTAEEAEKLVFAAEEGSIWLALLPGSGAEQAATAGQTASTLLK